MFYLLIIGLVIINIIVFVLAGIAVFLDEKKEYNNGKCFKCGNTLIKRDKKDFCDADEYYCESCGNKIITIFSFDKRRSN